VVDFSGVDADDSGGGVFVERDGKSESAKSGDAAVDKVTSVGVIFFDFLIVIGCTELGKQAAAVDDDVG
jgi:hypothetical protein